MSISPPSATELMTDPIVQKAIEKAWVDSLPGDPARRHEEGGWIYFDTTTGQISVRRQKPGQQAGIDLSSPPTVSGSVVGRKVSHSPKPVCRGLGSGTKSSG